MPKTSWGLTAGLLVALLFLGAGCSQDIQKSSLTSENQNVPEGWQTYKNTEVGFSLDYPGNQAADVTNGAILIDAVGGKERKLFVHTSIPENTSVDTDGCFEFSLSTQKMKVTHDNITFCVTVRVDSGMGYTGKEYHHVAIVNGTLVDIKFTIYYVTSSRVFEGCDTDADQAKQECINLTFNEERDTALFKEIMQTFRVMPLR